MTASSNYHERIADLEDRVAYLEDDLAIALRTDQIASLCRIGLRPSAAHIVLALYKTGRTMSDEALFERMPRPAEGETIKGVQSHIHRARKTIGYDIIETVRSIGYRLTAAGHALVKNALEGTTASA